MTEKFRASEATEWNSHGNIGRGKVRKKLTTRTLLKGHAVARDDGDDDTISDRPAETDKAPRQASEGRASERS
jgi:hypothetical protein